mgnify:CR=1 FL=1
MGGVLIVNSDLPVSKLDVLCHDYFMLRWEQLNKHTSLCQEFNIGIRYELYKSCKSSLCLKYG